MHKLGKVALDKNTKNVPEVDILEDDDGLDVLVKSALDNRNNRFTRNNPATFADKVKANGPSLPTSSNQGNI